MASLIPLLIQMAPAILSNLPGVIKTTGHILGKTIEGITDVMKPEENNKEIRTIDGKKHLENIPSQTLQQQSFEKSKLGINENTFVRDVEPRQYSTRREPQYKRRMVKRY